MSGQVVSGDWGGDTSPSLPESLVRKKHVSLGGGFCFTDSGISHDMSEAEVESMRVPPFAPSYPVGRG